MEFTDADRELLKRLFAVELHQRRINRLLDRLGLDEPSKLDLAAFAGALTVDDRALLVECLGQIRTESGPEAVAAAVSLRKRLRSE
jgi:branched-subunit amino acid aminotransferase/4-amino-4-deoxychorismate lyase